ncbi:MAG TPA: sulfite exporter TauE/SafE family protein [Phycisphaerae bacterium]|nr:sulfite exporter TauE/SafE family protein [Phycisphaerae bacterium]HRW55927.1 sulfite exporter TauE/SafE family protein [Phycisphaerae bacterium]
MEVQFSLSLLSFLIGVGLLAGFCGGLLGIGGSVIIIPALILWFRGDGQHLFQATAMMVNFFVVAPAVIRHFAARAYDAAMLRGMIPSAIVGILVGVWLSEFDIFRGPGQGRLQLIFATFLLYIFFQNLTWLVRGKPERPPVTGEKSNRGLTGALFVGAPAGVLSGLLGIGGGLFMVPAQQSLLKLPLKMSIANSASTILFSSVVGAIYKTQGLSAHGTSWSSAILMASMLAPTAMIGAWFGAAKSHVWPVRTVRIAFALLLAYSSYRLYTIGWNQLHS